MQSKTHSLIEQVANISIKYPIAIMSQVLIFPIFGINIPIGDNLLIGLYFTIISIFSGFGIRRLFNLWTIYIHEEEI